MRGIEDFNFPAFRAAATWLRSLGYEVVDPSEKGVIDGWTWEQYLKHDLREILDCDGVATMPESGNSKGSWLETTVALHLGMPVREVGHWASIAPGRAA